MKLESVLLDQTRAARVPGLNGSRDTFFKIGNIQKPLEIERIGDEVVLTNVDTKKRFPDEPSKFEVRIPIYSIVDYVRLPDPKPEAKPAAKKAA